MFHSKPSIPSQSSYIINLMFKKNIGLFKVKNNCDWEREGRQGKANNNIYGFRRLSNEQHEKKNGIMFAYISTLLGLLGASIRE